jgi:Fe-S cluster biogenesis protein NfuA
MIDPGLPRRLQQLAADIRALGDGSGPEESDRTRDLIQTVLDFHRGALAQLLDLIRREGEAGSHILENAMEDGLVASLLLLHGLHPTDLESRTEHALDQVRPFLNSQGADVRLVAIAEDAVRVRLHRGGTGYPASVQMLQAAIEEAIAAAAPDVRLVEFVESDVANAAETSGAASRFSLPVLPHPAGNRTV